MNEFKYSSRELRIEEYLRTTFWMALDGVLIGPGMKSHESPSACNRDLISVWKMLLSDWALEKRVSMSCAC